MVLIVHAAPSEKHPHVEHGGGEVQYGGQVDGAVRCVLEHAEVRVCRAQVDTAVAQEVVFDVAVVDVASQPWDLYKQRVRRASLA